MAVYARYRKKTGRFLLRLIAAGIFICTLAAVISGGMMVLSVPAVARNKLEEQPAKLQAEQPAELSAKLQAEQPAELEDEFYELTAANISYDWQHEVLEAVEDVRFEARDYRFEADWIKVYIEENLVLAGGDPVRVLAEGEEITGREISFNYLTGEGEFIQPKTRIDEVTFSGNRLSRASENGHIYSLEETFYTPCRFPEPHYSIRAERVTIYPEDRVVAEGAAFYWGESRILGLPYYVLKFTEDPDDPENMILQDTGFIQKIGYDSSEGFILGLGYNYEVFGRIAGRLAYSRTAAGSEIREVENYLTITDNLELEAGYHYRDLKEEREELYYLYYAGWKYELIPGLTIGQQLGLLQEWQRELQDSSGNISHSSTHSRKQTGRNLAGISSSSNNLPGNILAGTAPAGSNLPGDILAATAKETVTGTASTGNNMPGNKLAGTATETVTAIAPTGSNLSDSELAGSEPAGRELADNGPVGNGLGGGDREEVKARRPLTTYLKYEEPGRDPGRKFEIELEYDFLADSWRQEFFYQEVFRKDPGEALAPDQNSDQKLQKLQKLQNKQKKQKQDKQQKQNILQKQQKQQKQQKLAFSFYHDYRDWNLDRREYLLELDYSGADWQLRYREGYDTDYLPYLSLELPLREAPLRVLPLMELSSWELSLKELPLSNNLVNNKLVSNNLELAAGLGRLARAERVTDRFKISPSWQFSRENLWGWDLTGESSLTYIHHFSPEEAGNFAALEYEFQLERLFWRSFQDSDGFFRELLEDPNLEQRESPNLELSEDLNLEQIGGFNPEQSGGLNLKQSGSFNPEQSEGLNLEQNGGLDPEQSEGLSLEQSGGLSIEAAHTRGSIYLKENEEEKIEPIRRLTPFSSIILSGADDFRLEIRGELEYDLLQLDWRRTGLGLNLKLPGAGPDSFYVFDFQGDYGNRQGAWQELNFQLKRILDCYSFNFNYEAVDQVFSLGFDLNI